MSTSMKKARLLASTSTMPRASSIRRRSRPLHFRPRLRRSEDSLIEEEFGGGIMSAIDFDMDVTRKADPKGDRVAIGMSGKFLPFKYYGATGNAMAYGLKEE